MIYFILPLPQAKLNLLSYLFMKFDGIGKIAKHDLLVLSRNIGNTFSRISDKILLIIIFPFAIGLTNKISDVINSALIKFGQLGLYLFSILIALAAVFSTRSRIQWHRENGILAPIALRREAMMTYGTIALILCFGASLTVIGVSLRTALALFVGLLAALAEISVLGWLLSKIIRPIGRFIGDIEVARHLNLQGNRRARTWDMISAITFIPMLGFRGNVAALALASIVLGGLFLILSEAGIELAAVAFSIASVFLILILSIMLRLPHSLASYFLLTGTSPWNIGAVFVIFWVALLTPFSFVLIALPHGISALSVELAFAIAIAALGIISLLQAAHYALRPRTAANTAIQFEIATFAIVGGLLGPAVIVLASARIAMLARAIRNKRLLLA
jgi:hypothetical protein